MTLMRKIIILGDSFTFGHGCSDREFHYDEVSKTFIGDSKPFINGIPSEKCWPALLQQKYTDIQVVNLAKPANCNQGMFRNLLDYCKDNPLNENDIVMYNGTFPTRIEIASGEKPEVAVPWVMGWDHHSQMESAIQYNIAKKLYITHLFNDGIGYIQAVSSILATYGFATTYKTKFIWSIPKYAYPPDILNKLNILSHLRITDISKYDFSGMNRYDFNKTCEAIDSHINDLGHSIYFEKQIIPVIQPLL